MVNLGVTAKPKERSCNECGGGFLARRYDQVFCSPECRFEDHNRTMLRGRELYRLAYHWVLNASPTRRSLINDISRQARAWRDEDRAAGRRPPPLPEELVTRKENARAGYVRSAGRGYVKDREAAEAVLRELAR